MCFKCASSRAVCDFDQGFSGCLRQNLPAGLPTFQLENLGFFRFE